MLSQNQESNAIFKSKYKPMIKSFLLLFLFFITSFASAQKSTAWYNHTLLDVQNLESSVAFYTQVFQADTIPYPFPPSPQYIVKWLRVGEGVELHLSQWVNNNNKVIRDIPSEPGHVGLVHLGFMVISMDAFLKRLMEVSSDYKSGKYKHPIIDRMPYGAKTIEIKDPDGNEIHVIEAMPAK
jgi:catechol 2,3-dioxygenase-like lactoylglutathione lyase family enzyme